MSAVLMTGWSGCREPDQAGADQEEAEERGLISLFFATRFRRSSNSEHDARGAGVPRPFPLDFGKRSGFGRDPKAARDSRAHELANTSDKAVVRNAAEAAAHEYDRAGA